MSGQFCKSSDTPPPQNYIYSGLDTLQSQLHEWCLLFNTESMQKLIQTLDFESVYKKVLDNPDINHVSTYKSRSGFNTQREHYDKEKILYYQDFPYKVAYAAFGCNHDFYDTIGANICWQELHKGITSLDKTMESKFIRGLSTTTTSTLDKFWEQGVTHCEHKLVELNMSFPTTNCKITREKVEITLEENEDISDDKVRTEKKTAAKAKDLKNITDWLASIDIDHRRLVWVIDTYQSWLDNVSDRKLDISQTIARIDGASTSLNGSITHPSVTAIDKLKIGPYIFKLSGDPDYPIYIYKEGITDANNVLSPIAGCNTGASVTTIINRIQALGRNLAGARSATQNLYNIEFLIELDPNEQILILELIKAAGDQAPIDICSYCLDNWDTLFEPEDSSIFIFATGDLLAYGLAKSRGLAAFLITSSKIEISIPNCLISQDAITPIFKNFVLKLKEYYIFSSTSTEQISYFMSIILRMISFSSPGQLLAYTALRKLYSFLVKINANISILKTAIKYYTDVATTGQNISLFLEFLSNNLNSISFVPDELYDFFFSSKSDELEGYSYDDSTRSFTHYSYDPYMREVEARSNRTIDFCDNIKTLENPPVSGIKDCTKTSETFVSLLRNKPDGTASSEVVNYIHDRCAVLKANAEPFIKTHLDNNCPQNYGRYLQLVNVNVPKSHIFRNLLVDQYKLHEGYLLVGKMRVIDYEQTTDRKNYRLNVVSGYPIQVLHPIDDVYVPLNVLENTANSFIVDLLWQIPYDAFNLPRNSADTIVWRDIYKTMIYLLKTIHIGINGLDIFDTAPSIQDYIRYIFIGIHQCPYQSVNENGQYYEVADSEPEKKTRAKRGVQSTISDRATTDDRRKLYSRFINACFAMCNSDFDCIIDKVVEANDDDSFQKLLSGQVDCKLTFSNIPEPNDAILERILKIYDDEFEHINEGIKKYLNTDTGVKENISSAIEAIRKTTRQIETIGGISNIIVLASNGGGKKIRKKKTRKNILNKRKTYRIKKYKKGKKRKTIRLYKRRFHKITNSKKMIFKIK
jgi:hypothetical protein